MTARRSLLVGTGVAVGTATVIATAPIIIGAIGFASAGVLAGSFAAAWQSTIGGYIASGSIFATLQSIGATGAFLSTTTTCAVVGAAGATAGAIATR